MKSFFHSKNAGFQRRAVRPGRKAHDGLEFLGKVHVVGVTALLGDLGHGQRPAVKLHQQAGVADAHIGEELHRRAAGDDIPYDPPAPAPEPEETEPEETEPEETKPEENKPARMTWDEIKADPEYNAEMQKMMQERVKKSKEAEENLSKVTPLLSLIAQKYGQDPANIDYDTLIQAVYKDDGNFEDRALAEGKPVEEVRQQAYQNLEQQKIPRHIQNLEQQGEALKQMFPNFDLRTELQNPAFARMTSPSVGISVEDAYHAIHRKEIQQAAMHVTAEMTAKKISNSIQAGQRRPDEHGTSGQAASVNKFDYAKASKQEREALKKAIYAAKARGEKLYPG